MRANFLHNTKISGSAKFEEMAIQKKKYSAHPRARGKSLMEIEQLVLGYPTNYTTIQYIHVSTHPMEERKGFDKKAPVEKINDARERANEDPFLTPQDVLDVSLPVISLRQDLPVWRHFSNCQEVMIKDNIFSTITVDKITRFSIRPPELRSFDLVSKYFSWFSVSTKQVPSQQMPLFIHQEMPKSFWIDGMGCIIKIRAPAISSAYEYVLNYTGPLPPNPILVNFCGTLNHLHQKITTPGMPINDAERVQWRILSSKFVDLQKKFQITCGGFFSN